MEVDAVAAVFGILGISAGSVWMQYVQPRIDGWMLKRTARGFWHFLSAGDLAVVHPIRDADKVIPGTQVWDIHGAALFCEFAEHHWPQLNPVWVYVEIGSANNHGADTATLSQRNLLVVGGPIPNRIAFDLFGIQGIKYRFGGAGDHHIVDGTMTVLSPQRPNDILVRDCGIITCVPNPYAAADSGLFMVSVCGAWGSGTCAGLVSLTQREVLAKLRKALKEVGDPGAPSFQILFECDVVRGRGTNIMLRLDTFAAITLQ